MSKKTIFFTIICSLMFFTGISGISAGNQDALLGTWLVAAKDGKVEIYRCGSRYCGKIVWTQIPDDKDSNNPDPARRNDKLQGKLMLQNFSFDGGKWVDGTIYDPGDGKSYSCMMWMDGNNRLWVKGYIGISLLGRKELWTRIE